MQQRWLFTHKKYLSLMIIFAIILAGGIILQAFSLVKVVTLVFIDQSKFTKTVPYLTLLLVAIIARLTTQFSLNLLGGKLSQAVKDDLRQKLLYKWSRNAIESNEQHFTGEKVSLFVDTVEQMESYYREYIPHLIKIVFVPIAIVIVVFLTNVNSAWIMIVTAPFIPITYIIIGLQVQKKSEQQLESMNQFSGKFLDILQGLQTIRLFQQGDKQAKVLERSNSQFMQRTIKVLKTAFVSTLFLELITTLSIGIVALEIGFQMIVFKQLSFPTAFLVLALAPEYYNSLKELGTAFHTGKGSLGAAQLIKAELEKQDRPVTWGSHDIAKKASLQLINACITYNGSTVIGPINLFIPYQKKIAIIGPTGQGKSTILNMLASAIELSEGEFRIAGNSRYLLSKDDWYNRVSYISQHPYIFAGTIRDNIQMGLNCSDEEIIQALQHAKLSDWINSLPNGLDTKIGESGIGISGGEKQRIAITRAFLKQPEYLFLDEPTASLDVVTEQYLANAIKRLGEKATVVIIAHRFASIQHVDEIIIVDNGKIIAQGSHEDLTEHPYYEALKEAL